MQKQRWGAIKSLFTRRVGLQPTRNPSKLRKGDGGDWQQRFREHCIRDAKDYTAHVEYCHWNPVKHGLVAEAEAWPYSTVHRAVREGRFV